MCAIVTLSLKATYLLTYLLHGCLCAGVRRELGSRVPAAARQSSPESQTTSGGQLQTQTVRPVNTRSHWWVNESRYREPVLDQTIFGSGHV